LTIIDLILISTFVLIWIYMLLSVFKLIKPNLFLLKLLILISGGFLVIKILHVMISRAPFH